MRYLLDTNAVIDVVRGPGSLVEARLRELPPDLVGLPVVVLHELYHGAHRSSRREHNVAVVDEIGLQVVELGPEDAREAGRVRAELAAAGTPVGPFDVLIAGQALARDLTLVTNNTTELSRVPALRLADWSRPPAREWDAGR